MRGDPSGDSDDIFSCAGDPPELRLLHGTPHAALPGTGTGRGLAVLRAFVSHLSPTRRGGARALNVSDARREEQVGVVQS